MAVPAAIRAEVADRDEQRCAYCQTSEANSGLAMHLDHIVPEVAGGTHKADNLCLVCFNCNVNKGAQQSAIDPETGREASLFNPVRQSWQQHFEWSPDATLIIGKTPEGRATVLSLKMNNPTVVFARRRWVAAGWHPPHRA
ncbi:MAG: HNH endonuclease [Acidobacteriota bacterium]